ncbi:hypothetical protein PVK06_005575 [Gossypium arboreum]|uniref:Reverse transcriptase n=1 Tax=Gossypium arboreum TaxID=29729 RepID=A0ABR0QVD6_GOSAR|nr:hypothetical protein PVK06_005575 [Gossypium arboreum]
MWSRRPKDHSNDPRLCFKFDDYWANDGEAKKVISNAWNMGALSYVENLDNETWCRLGYFYAKEENYWAQRSRPQCFKEGDRNTRYFRPRATGRFKKNNIGKLKDLNEAWVTDNKETCNVAKNYFCRLFQSNSQIIDNQDLDYIQECINKETNDWLIMDDSKSEVVQTIKHMDPCKAPGTPIRSSLRFSQIDSKLPSWGVLVKIKVLFFLGRMIHENILISHELLHYLQSSKNGPNKGFVIKLDMSKAYDRVEWNFIELVMRKMGFVDK